MISGFKLSILSGLLASVAIFSAQAQEIDSSFANAFPIGSGANFSQSPLDAKVKGRRAAAVVLHRRAGPRGRSNPFVGTWISNLTRTKNSCDPASTPQKVTVGLGIDGKLIGSDKGDGSPFFTGRVLAANRIGFARSRTINGCTQTQVYILGNVSGSRGAVALRSDTTCGSQSCSTTFSGPAAKR